MKLHEITGQKEKKKYRGNSSSTVTIEPVEGMYGKVDIDVNFDYTPPSTTRHGDNYTFDEHHGSEIEIVDYVLDEDVHEVDHDGEIVKGGRTWHKGSDPAQIHGWTHADEDLIYDALVKESENREDDFDEPDDYDDREGDYHDDYMSRHK